MGWCLCSSISGLHHKAPLFLAWAPSLGLVKQMALGGFSPGHVPWPLSGLLWLLEPLFLATSEALQSNNGGPLLSHLQSFKLWNWTLPECGEAVPNLPQLIKQASLSLPTRFAFSCLPLCRCLSERVPPQQPSVGPGLCSVGKILPQCWFLPRFLFISSLFVVSVQMLSSRCSDS